MAASPGVAISIDSEDQVAREVGDPRTAREAHRRADFLTQDLEGAGNAGGAGGGETPEGGSPDRHHLRPARQSLHHIGPAREAAVDHDVDAIAHGVGDGGQRVDGRLRLVELTTDRKSTRLNSSHGYISYAVFCLKKKKKKYQHTRGPHTG